MPLTPADVHNVAFKKPPIGKRGYDEDEVDEFLDLVETELSRLIEENNDLKSQPAAGRSTAPAAAAPAAPAAPPAAEAGSTGDAAAAAAAGAAVAANEGDQVKAVRMLALAQETADRHVSEAKSEADRVLAGARSEAQRLVADARGKADGLTGESRTRAESIERDARNKAAALTDEAERRHQEVMGSLSTQKGELEKAVEHLRVFEREYRSRMTTYFESQLQDLRGSETLQPSGGPARAGAGRAHSVDGQAGGTDRPVG
ncbi:MAG TPA: DivIVA domain-containing protein [Mycobacteriales bacterium]